MEVTVSGAHGEGGGQIVRTAVALAAVTKKHVRITRIRANRPKPGLQAQHVKCVEAVARLCGAETEGMSVGSEELVFRPGDFLPQDLTIDIGTAGSVVLVLQSILPLALHTGKEFSVAVTGGTHVPFAPTTDYFQHIFCNLVRRMGADVWLDVNRYGFYPVGGGKVRLQIRPSQLRGIKLLDRGTAGEIHAKSIASGHLKTQQVAERQLAGAAGVLGLDGEAVHYGPASSPGSSLHVHTHFKNTKLGAFALGEKGKPAQAVGADAARLLQTQLETRACLDQWMGDQILPYLAVAKGRSFVTVARLTEHAKTNMHVISEFLPVRFAVKDGSPAEISVTGRG